MSTILKQTATKTVDKPELPQKPSIAPKPTTAKKPSVPQTPAKPTKPAVAEDVSAGALASADVLKYISDNATHDAEVDLFS